MPTFDLGFPMPPSAILELKKRAANNLEVQREVELVLDILRLFRLGSTVARNAAYRPKSFIQFGGTLGYPLTQLVVSYRYVIKDSDAPKLNQFYERLSPIVARFSTFATPAVAGDSLLIAFQRYKEALFLAGATEARVTSAITCLEALFLRANERAELSHRLGQRVGAVLAVWGARPIEVYRNVSQAYEIRSAYIHGSSVPQDQQASAPALCERILDYARLSLVAFLQMRASQGDQFEKEKLLSRIDNSLLDDTARRRLREAVGALIGDAGSIVDTPSQTAGPSDETP
jgi:hypothetical protein